MLDQTPYQCWTREKPCVSNLKVFRCLAYTLIDAHNRTKLDDKSLKCIFVGYCDESKLTYRLYDPASNKIIISRNVVINEEAKWEWNERPGDIPFEPSEIEVQQPTIPNVPTTVSSESLSPTGGNTSSSTDESPVR